MQARGPMRTPCALITVVLVLLLAGSAMAMDQKNRFPAKVRSSESGFNPRGDVGARFGSPTLAAGDWETPAGQTRRVILCPKRGYSVEIGVRPLFSHLNGSIKALSSGGEGSYLSLHGHLRLPSDRIQWDLLGRLKTWDKITWRLDYTPWSWSGPGHSPTEGNFAGLLLHMNDPIHTDLNISSLVIGADYDVSYGRDLTFGPNADLHVIKWMQRVIKERGEAMDFTQTMLQPALGAHARYEPANTGYFSWFKPYLEARFSWMSLTGLGISTWDMALGTAPPLSRNLDAGIKVGYRQWKLDGNRNRLYLDVGVEGFYLDFALRF